MEDIELMVDRMNAMVPRDDAKVEMKMYGGGPDESGIMGTRRGYLRLGIEFMRAAFAPKVDPKRADLTDIDLRYLISEDSDVSFDWFRRIDSFPPSPQRTRLASKVFAVVMAVLIIGFCICGVIGIGTVISWIVA